MHGQPGNNNIIYMTNDKDRAIIDYAVLTPQATNPRIVRMKCKLLISSLNQWYFICFKQWGNSLDCHQKVLIFTLNFFLKVSDAFKIVGASQKALRLKLFPYSLRNWVRALLNSLLADFITTWNDLVDKFLMKYFPLTKNTKLINQITYFHQLKDKSLYVAWEIFKELLRRCPHHCIPCCILLSVPPFRQVPR